MSVDFLATMAAASRVRVREALMDCPRAELERRFGALVARGAFLPDLPGRRHPGTRDGGGRQATRRFSLQVGWGPDRAFLDIDGNNPLYGRWAKLKHALEIANWHATDYAKLARHLNIELRSQLQPRAQPLGEAPSEFP